MNLSEQMEDWHQRIARVGGAMALTLVRRGLTVGMLTSWANELERVAQAMRGAEEELNQRAQVRGGSDGGRRRTK